MTREEAIEVMKAYRDKLINSASNQLDGDIEALDMAIKALEQEPRWIPVSERLPEDEVEVLGCTKQGNQVVVYRKSYWSKFWNKDIFVTEESNNKYHDIVAWMPLPKPYEPQERSGEE